MTILHLLNSGDPQSISKTRTVASYEHELAKCRRTEIELQGALTREDTLTRQEDNLILKQEELSKEADHRLLNNVQMIVSLLTLQSRGTSAKRDMRCWSRMKALHCLKDSIQPPATDWA